MSKKLPAARVLLISTDGSTPDEIQSLVGPDQQRLRFVPIDASGVTAELAASNPTMILLNTQTVGEDESRILRSAREKAPHVPIIVASQKLDPSQMRPLLALGVNDWLCKPVSEDDLIETVRATVQKARGSQNSVHAVVSTVGGAGATSVAVSMADMAANKIKEKGQSVALFDLDFSTGNCGYLLNTINEYNLGSVLATPNRIDSEFLSVIQKQHPNGFCIYSFKRPEIVTHANGFELVLRLLDAVSNEHDLTIIDIPYYETPWKDDVLNAVNGASLVTALNLPAIRHTLDMIDRLKEMRGPDFPINVLFNKWRSSLFGQRISARKLGELFGGRRRVTLSLDDALLGEAMDRGVPPSEVRSSAPFLRQITAYLKSIEV